MSGSTPLSRGDTLQLRTEILERFHSQILRTIVRDAPWYVSNEGIRHDLNVKTVKDEVRNFNVNY